MFLKNIGFTDYRRTYIKYLVLTSSLFLLYQHSFSQAVQPYKNKNVIKVGYGFTVAGWGDIPGQQFMLGVQNQFRRHHLYDIRLSGTWLEKNRNWGQGYTLLEKSNGISLEADYGFVLEWWRIKFYPSLGPALRYSHEVHPIYIGIWYDKNGNVTRFEAPVNDTYRWRAGGTGGLNLDFRLNGALSLGIRTSVQVYKGADTFTFYGLTLKNTKWHF